MSFDILFSFRVTPTEHAGVKALAEQRGLSVSALVRSMIERELEAYPRREQRKQEAFDQILYLAILLDGVYAQREPDLRSKLIQVWRDRLAEEGRTHG
ncbi:hypothetical protein [uncultured Sphingomonas sp.]|uniref:plasmid mobilization protein n=1 Tax=uncultured Sphingomonas sp. TaxID=158754 RepID=UPI0035CAF824